MDADQREYLEGQMDLRRNDIKLERDKYQQERYPRVVIHLPEWISQLSVFHRGFKMAFLALGLVGCVGTFMYFSNIIPEVEGIKNSKPELSLMMKTPGVMTIGTPPPVGTTLPESLITVADFKSPFTMSDIPFLLHVPRSGATTIIKIMGKCIGLTQATDMGAREGTENEHLEVTYVEGFGRFINVDTYSNEGILRARGKGLATSGLVNAITSPLPYAAATLFDMEHRARIFIMLREPVERAISYFHYITNASWDPNWKPLFSSISIETYAKTSEDRPEFNYLTKVLSNNMNKDSDELTGEDINVAKQFLRQKILIGLLSDKTESLMRFQKYFGWNNMNEVSSYCGSEVLNWEKSNHVEQTTVDATEAAQVLLAKKNKFDIELYEYAKILFMEQAHFLYENPNKNAP